MILIPEGFSDELMEQITKANPFPRGEHKPLTRWQKLRMIPFRVKWAIHGFLFPECQDGDY